jgi:N-acyl-D-aspartate/D-glutamate deacylase
MRSDLRRALTPLALASVLGGCGSPEFDVVVSGGRVIDGTGSPAYAADVGIRDGRITALGDLVGRSASRTIAADGRVVTPGFIDMMGGSSYPLLHDPTTAESKLHQGITTMLAGEGGSMAPLDDRLRAEFEEETGYRPSWATFAEYFAILADTGVALNVVHNVGAAQVRRVVLGDQDVAPSPAQLDSMRALVEGAMRDGAVGLSTALIYPPGIFADTEELVALARGAAVYGGVYFTHMRNESFAVLEAIDEALDIGKEAAIPAHIFHLKAAGRENWPLMERAIRRIADARAAGLDVTADVYPYIRNGIGLGSFVHPRHYAAGDEAFRATLSDPEVRRALRREIETTDDWENWYRHVGFDWDKVLIARVGDEQDADLVGLSIAGAAERRGADVWTLFFDLVQRGGVGVNPESMNEEQKHLALRAPFIAIDTDASPMNPDSVAAAHPRAFGAFPRVLAKYVRAEGVIPLEEAIHKMSALPASILRLADRGRIAEGMAADVLVFDPERVQDRATFTDPLRYAEGIEYVIVNGEPVIDAGRATGARPGRVIRHGDSGRDDAARE